MADNTVATAYGDFEVKQTHELDGLNTINGEELILIDNGTETYQATIGTLVTFIANRILEFNGGTGQVSNGTSNVHIIYPKDKPIPAASRYKGHFYIRTTTETPAKLASGLPMVIKVSPNMGLKIVKE